MDENIKAKPPAVSLQTHMRGRGVRRTTSDCDVRVTFAY